MMGRCVLICGILALCLVVMVGNGVAQSNYPQPEQLLETENPERYARAALAYLEECPDCEFAPRVAFDLLMASTVLGNQEYADEMKKLLALDYAPSLQARYFRSTFADAKEYRAVLAGLLDQFAGNPDEQFARRYARGLGHALDDFGGPLLDNAAFTLKSAYLLGAADEEQAREDLLARLARMNVQSDELSAIAAIAANEQTSLSEKILRLHEVADNDTASFLRNLFLFELSHDALENPAIRQVAAEAFMESKQFAKALDLLEQQPLEEFGGKVLFQRAWCHAVLDESDKALALLAKLNDLHPESPWRGQGRILAEGVDNAAAREAAFVEALLALTASLEALEAFEGFFSYMPTGSARVFELYLALNMDENSFEAQLRHAGDLEFAYKTSTLGSMLFVKGQDAIRQTSEPGLVPSLGLDLRRDANDGFRVDFSANLVKDLEAFARSNRSLLDSPFVSTAEGARELVHYLLRSGYLLDEVRQTQARTTFMLRPLDARQPEPRSARPFTVNTHGQLTAFEMHGLAMQDARYGEAGDVQFSPPPWPRREIVTHETFDVGNFFTILGRLARLFPAQDLAQAQP